MSKKDLISNMVKQKISYIQKLDKHSSAILAMLRRGAGKIPGEDPKLLGFILEYIPEELLSKNDEPTKSEWAIYISLTLFALHQQGNDIVTKCMDADIGSFGNSLRELYLEDSDSKERIENRINAFSKSHTMLEASYYLRQMIQMLKSKDIKVDYGRLASDLYTFQNENGKRRIFLTWVQDFNRILNDKKGENKDE